LGLQYSKANDALGALSTPNARIAIIAATPAHLKQLASNMAKVNAFTQAGGSIIFNGLTPAGFGRL
jgi:hypothetical protein